MKKVLTIAGSDCSGGAGIQADLKTIAAHGLYGMSAVTALTAQNTTGVYGIFEATGEFLASQLDCIFKDIYPDAVKIGMVSGKELIHVIADKLEEYDAKNIVVDPVMVSTSGSRLLNDDAGEALVKRLFPLADVITPNVPEAEVLSGMQIKGKEDFQKAAEVISETMTGGILIKGGHEIEDANDYLYLNGEEHWFLGKRIDNPNTHGTGCTLSSAIASNLALGCSLPDSIRDAKKYLTGALEDGLDLGAGSGPLNHMYRLKDLT
nr:bifunctional hydroxymethylpyrimidine kinase/phosphomethylpyrimidine kinase [uncultured Anaerostipes sp.]